MDRALWPRSVRVVDLFRSGAIKSVSPGTPETLVFDRQAYVFWWGSTGGDDDGVSTLGSSALLFLSVEECTAAVSTLAPHADFDPDGSITDVTAAQSWLTHRQTTLELEPALNLLNWSLDLTSSVGGDWDPRIGGIRRVCYEKLFAANLPWVFGRSEFSPQWTRRELVELRIMLNTAARFVRQVVRRGLTVDG